MRYHNPNSFQVHTHIGGKRTVVSPLAQLIRQPELKDDANWCFFIEADPADVTVALDQKQLVPTKESDYPPVKPKRAGVAAQPAPIAPTAPAKPSAAVPAPVSAVQAPVAATAPAVAVTTPPAGDVDKEDAAKSEVYKRLTKQKK